jgi:hypothetical protein
VTAPGAAAPRPATRGDRLRDLAAVACLVVGAGLVVASHLGMRRLATGPIVVAQGEYAIVQFNRYYYVELAGYVLVLVGIVVGVASYVAYARRGRVSPDAAPDVTDRT